MKGRNELAGIVKPYFAKSMPSIERMSATRPGGPQLRTGPESASLRPLPRQTRARKKTASNSKEEIVLGELISSQDSSRDIVRLACQSAGWLLRDADGRFDVDIPVGEGRAQVVSVHFDQQDETGESILLFESPCGPALGKNAMALLRRNARMCRTAFAVEKREDLELLVLRGVQLVACASKTSVAGLLALIARCADSIERKLGRTDEY